MYDNAEAANFMKKILEISFLPSDVFWEISLIRYKSRPKFEIATIGIIIDVTRPYIPICSRPSFVAISRKNQIVMAEVRNLDKSKGTVPDTIFLEKEGINYFFRWGNFFVSSPKINFYFHVLQPPAEPAPSRPAAALVPVVVSPG